MAGTPPPRRDSQTRNRPAPPPATGSDRIARLAFVAALCFMAFGYGIAVMKWRLFPHSVITEAAAALDALRKVETAAVPPHFMRAEPDATAPGPVGGPLAAPEAGPVPDDLIVMTGGFFQRQDLCPDLGCMAWIMDRSGKILHTWSADPASLFTAEDLKGFSGFADARDIYVQGTDLDPEGNLVVTFQGRNVFPYHVGVAKFDRAGKLLWKRIDHSHHWPTTGPDGRIYLPAAKIGPVPPWLAGTAEAPACPGNQVYEEGLRILGPDGTQLREIWVREAAQESDVNALSWSIRDGCDPYHVNGIDLLNAAATARLHAAGFAEAAAGDLAVSLRSSSAIVLMKPDTGRIYRILHGPMVAQHSPATLPDGRILAFDNLGAAGPSGTETLTRIIAFDPGTGRAETLFPKPGSGETLRSEAEGAVNVSPDGTRILVAETYGGRVIEVEIATGRLLWQYDEINATGPWAERFPDAAKTPFARMQVQGGAYLSRAEFDRLFGPRP